MSQVLWLTWLY